MIIIISTRVITFSVFNRVRFLYWVLQRGLLQLKGLVPRALAWIVLRRFEVIRWDLFIGENVTVTCSLNHIILRFAHAQILLVLAWTVARVRLLLFDLDISPPQYFGAFIPCCHRFLQVQTSSQVLGSIFRGYVCRMTHRPLSWIFDIPQRELSVLRQNHWIKTLFILSRAT